MWTILISGPQWGKERAGGLRSLFPPQLLIIGGGVQPLHSDWASTGGITGGVVGGSGGEE